MPVDVRLDDFAGGLVFAILGNQLRKREDGIGAFGKSRLYGGRDVFDTRREDVGVMYCRIHL